MIRNVACLCVLMIIASSHIAAAQQHGGETLQELLISPDVVLRHGADIGLSGEQVQTIRKRVEQTGREAREVDQRADEAMGRLAKLLSADEVDEEAALKQLDEVLAIEKEQKSLHLRIMIFVRNELTPQQRQVAARLARTATSNEGLEQRLQAKLSQIERQVQKRSDAGQPPFEAVGLMQTFPELMQNGQVREAEALLDRVLAMLGGNNAERTPGQLPERFADKIQTIQRRAQQMQHDGEDVSEIQQLMTQLAPLIQQGKTKDAEQLIDRALKLTGQGPGKNVELDEETNRNRDSRPSPRSPATGLLEPFSAEGVRAEFEALRKEDVAWRQIQWKTCLLDGLKASREQNKPIMLWVFIDRPIDDERC